MPCEQYAFIIKAINSMLLDNACQLSVMQDNVSCPNTFFSKLLYRPYLLDGVHSEKLSNFLQKISVFVFRLTFVTHKATE